MEKRKNRDFSMTTHFYFSLVAQSETVNYTENETAPIKTRWHRRPVCVPIAHTGESRYPVTLPPGSRIRSGMDQVGARLTLPDIFIFDFYSMFLIFEI
jgi:hypothetical protein